MFIGKETNLCVHSEFSSLLFSLTLFFFFTKPSILPVTTVANLCSHWYCPLRYSPLNNSFLHGIEGKAFLIWKMEMYWNNIYFKNTDINTIFLKKILCFREYRSRFTSEETLMFCMRVMVGVIILYDHVHPVGAFSKASKIDVRITIGKVFLFLAKIHRSCGKRRLCWVQRWFKTYHICMAKRKNFTLGICS